MKKFKTYYDLKDEGRVDIADIIARMSELIKKITDASISHCEYSYYANLAMQVSKQTWELVKKLDMELGFELVTAYVRNW